MKQKLHSTKIFAAALAMLLLILTGSVANACNANFTHTNVCVGDTIWFYAADQYAVYTWDFGDSTSMTNINHDTATFHVYQNTGTYYVTLFVNIGAEWDYLTQIITVGTTCFNAGFTTVCGGSYMETFNDVSIGNMTYRRWTFGEPSSGPDDTSFLWNPYHTYAAAGNYSVTLIVSDGVNTDTLTQVVVVPANCISANIGTNIMGNCYNDSTHYNVYYTGTITSYSWDFGDPNSGADNYSTLAIPAHLYTAIGTYVVRLIITDGTSTDTIYSVQIVADCTCWAGDCNRDGEVNGEDIFAIGIYYGSHGLTRPNASNSFTSQPSTDWSSVMWNYMYLQVLADKKYADCNGDSTINSLDMIAINNNYGMHHNTHNNRSAMPEALPTDPAMYLQFPVSSTPDGSVITATINLGTSAIPFTYLYGYSFTINFDTALVIPNSTTVDVSGNWLGNATNELSISHAYTDRIEEAVVRYDQVQIAAGYGQIGTVTFHIRPNVFGTLHATINPTAKAITTTMFNNTVASNQEIFKPVNLMGSDLDIFIPVGINEAASSYDGISVFPNPTNELLTISLNKTEATEIKITNTLGKVVYSDNGQFKTTLQVNTSNLSTGIYSLSLVTKDGILVKKLNIIK